MSQKLGSSLLKQASERQISSLRWAPGATFWNPWDPDPPCSSGFLLMTLLWVGSHVLAPGNDGYVGPIKQLVKLIRPPENWTAVSAVKWLYQLYWNQNIKRMVFPLSLPGPSYQRPCPAGACVSPLVSQEADVWFPLWETRDEFEVSPIGADPFPYSGSGSMCQAPCSAWAAQPYPWKELWCWGLIWAH